MELRDYLMPGEYIFSVFTDLDISPGNLNGLAVTNKRIILFNTNSGISKLFRRNRSEGIKNLKSTFFDDAHMIQMEVYEKSLGRQEIISLTRYVKLFRSDGSCHYAVDSTIAIIKPKLNGPSISEIKEALEYALKSIAVKTEYNYSEKDMAWIVKFVIKLCQK
ncbi:hypothetical protein JCM16138_17250 [Thermococcus atlanticus]